MRESAWVYPILEIIHIIGIALLLGNLIVFEARVLGAGKTLDLTALARLALPLAVLGFLLAAMSGLTMFATQALELLPLTRMQAWNIEPIKKGETIEVVGFTFPKQEGEAILLAECLFRGGKAYGLRSSPV